MKTLGWDFPIDNECWLFLLWLCEMIIESPRQLTLIIFHIKTLEWTCELRSLVVARRWRRNNNKECFPDDYQRISKKIHSHSLSINFFFFFYFFFILFFLRLKKKVVWHRYQLERGTNDWLYVVHVRRSATNASNLLGRWRRRLLGHSDVATDRRAVVIVSRPEH